VADTAQAARLGTIGLSDPFVEGHDRTRRVAREAHLREARVAAARSRREWMGDTARPDRARGEILRRRDDRTAS
jgi:hypothetical protein